MMGRMRRNLIAGLLIAGGLALMASALPGLGLVQLGSAPAVSQSIPALGDPLSPPHQHPKFLPGTGSTAAGPNQVVAYLSIPKLGIKNAPIFDRGVDQGGTCRSPRATPSPTTPTPPRSAPATPSSTV